MTKEYAFGSKPVSGENHAIGAKDREECSLDLAADDIVLALVDIWQLVAVIFTNLNKLLEHSSREIGDSILRPSQRRS